MAAIVDIFGHDAHRPLDPSADTDAQPDFSAFGMFDQDTLPSESTGAVEEMKGGGGADGEAMSFGGVEDQGMEADQNEWMKVFVPSLLMAGFPKQIPTSEMQDLVPPRPAHSPDSGPADDPSTPVAAPPVCKVSFDLPPATRSSIPTTHLGSSSTPMQTGTTISPPHSLSALQYPFQTLDLYDPSFMSASQQFASLQLPPLTPCSTMMQYLTFPETPVIPGSDQGQGGGAMGAGAMMGGSTGQIPSGGQEPPREPEGWNLFRMPVASSSGKIEQGTQDPDARVGMKRKRLGRPRCTFNQPRPSPAPAPASAPNSSSRINLAAASPAIARVDQIQTQGALEAELQAAVDELNGRVRGILDRATPEVVRDSGVSAVLGDNDKSGDWSVAKAIISKVIGVPQDPMTRLSASPPDVPASTPLAAIKAERPTSDPSTSFKGPWVAAEISRLREIVATSVVEVEGVEMVDWNRVVESFGPTRTKHQILLKAVELGLKGSTTTVGRRKRQKRHQGQTASSGPSRSVSSSGEDGDAEDEIHTSTTATSVSSL